MRGPLKWGVLLGGCLLARVYVDDARGGTLWYVDARGDTHAVNSHLPCRDL